MLIAQHREILATVDEDIRPWIEKGLSLKSKKSDILDLVEFYQYDKATRPMSYYRPTPKQKEFHFCDAITIILTGGNRIGKTHSAIGEASMAGQGIHPVRGKYRKGTHDSPFCVRFISKPDYITHDIQPLLERMLPFGSIKKRKPHSAGYDKYWICEGEGWYAKYDFMSTEQSIDKFESTGLDLIIVNEPCSYSIYKACATRLIGGSPKPVQIIFVLTPLEGANWMRYEFWEGKIPFKNVEVVKAGIWSNCRCLTPEAEGHGTDCQCHGGYLYKSAIDEMLERLKKDPIEYRARVDGDFVFEVRNVFPNFNQRVHIVNPTMFPHWVDGYRPNRGVTYITMDPHGARPDFVQFWVIDQTNTLYLIDEFPSFLEGDYKMQPYEHIKDRPLEPKLMARIIIDKARRIGLPVGGLGIDPHFGAMAYNPRDAVVKTVVEVMNDALHDLDPTFPFFQLAKANRSEGVSEIHAGHLQIRELLYYDPDKPLVKGNLPGMFLVDRCENSIRGIMNYRYKQPVLREGNSPVTQDVEEEFKHPVDCTRYLFPLQPHFYDQRSLTSYSYDPPSARVA